MGGDSLITDSRLASATHEDCGKAGILRCATVTDLPAINEVVTSAVRTWGLPERVLRLALPSLLYQKSDFSHMAVVVAEDGPVPTAAAAWETAAYVDAPRGRTALLLHGIYVTPDRQRTGLGRRLVEHADAIANLLMLDGLAVKAWRDSVAFFTTLGFITFGDNDALYPRWMWRTPR